MFRHNATDSKERILYVKKQTTDIDSIMEKYPGEPQYLISLLQDVQAQYSYISEENIRFICDHVGVPVTKAWSVLTFYRSFNIEPRGEHLVRVCCGTACHLKGAERIAEDLERHLCVQREHTTEDMHFTLETINCPGACAVAPVVMVDDDYLGATNQADVRNYLKKL
ncbi:putative NADH:ubiquinone oxidoreductase 24 kD subunit, NuoE [uncultured Desulfobacterium sp.]|uniref:Putative NADH:ubiquinone oxidoreductase 24 kD subunit, NuoE n=1 Tax=uncultured Desulfobacterium sp. TaxID=201089 RepID=A0A445MQZ6_9BACT|nr:putative NADH:ubiquinone oxidoreductase 24 kD subunit, NuoE [uncultured Desulfobacterium sp.]